MGRACGWQESKAPGRFPAQGQNIPLPVSRDCLRLYPLYHNSWNKRAIWLHISISRTVPAAKDSPVLLPHTAAYPQCLLLPWKIGNISLRCCRVQNRESVHSLQSVLRVQSRALKIWFGYVEVRGFKGKQRSPSLQKELISLSGCVHVSQSSPKSWQ